MQTQNQPAASIQLDPLAYSIPELAALAAVGRTTLYLEIAEGRLRPTKIRGRTVITAKEAQRWLDSLTAVSDEGNAR